MAQVTALSPLGTPGVPYAFAAKVAAAVYVARGAILLWETSHWAGQTMYFEATMLAAVGSVLARLRDTTADSVVANSTLETAAAAATRLRSSGLTLVDGHEYRPEYGKAAGDSGTGYAGRWIGI